MNEVLIGGILTTIIGPIITWFFTRKKYKTEVDDNIITNMSRSLEFYKQLSDDNKERLETIMAQNTELLKRVTELEDRVMELQSENRELRTKLNIV